MSSRALAVAALAGAAVAAAVAWWTPRRPPSRFGNPEAGIAILARGFQAHRSHITRGCRANQRAVVGAIEMFDLDGNRNVLADWPGLRTHPGPRPLHWFRASELADRLEKAGYLQRYPRDPGFPGEDTLIVLDREHGIFCLNHGFLWDTNSRAEAPPRAQLAAAGVRDPDLLALAATEYRQPTLGPWTIFLVEGGELELGLVLLMAAYLWTRRGRWTRVTLALGGSFLGTLLGLALSLGLTEVAPLTRPLTHGAALALALLTLGVLAGALPPPSRARAEELPPDGDDAAVR